MSEESKRQTELHRVSFIPIHSHNSICKVLICIKTAANVGQVHLSEKTTLQTPLLQNKTFRSEWFIFPFLENLDSGVCFFPVGDLWSCRPKRPAPERIWKNFTLFLFSSQDTTWMKPPGDLRVQRMLVFQTGTQQRDWSDRGGGGLVELCGVTYLPGVSSGPQSRVKHLDGHWYVLSVLMHKIK